MPHGRGLFRQHLGQALRRVIAGAIAVGRTPLEDRPDALQDATRRFWMRQPARTERRQHIRRRHRVHALGPTRGEERAKRRQPLLAVLAILKGRD